MPRGSALELIPSAVGKLRVNDLPVLTSHDKADRYGDLLRFQIDYLDRHRFVLTTEPLTLNILIPDAPSNA